MASRAPDVNCVRNSHEGSAMRGCAIPNIHGSPISALLSPFHLVILEYLQAT